MTTNPSADLIELLADPALAVSTLYGIWEQRQPVQEHKASLEVGAALGDQGRMPWFQQDMGLAPAFTGAALAKEEFLLVCDAAKEALRLWDGVGDAGKLRLVEVQRDYACALARLGSGEKAKELLTTILRQRNLELSKKLEGSIQLQLGNIFLEEALEMQGAGHRTQLLHQAYEAFDQAGAGDPEAIGSRLQVALAGFLLGEAHPTRMAKAKAEALEILKRAREIGKKAEESVESVLAQAVTHAILGEIDAAADGYDRLARTPGVTTAILADARYHARFLAEALGEDRNLFKSAFPSLQLVVFAGHMPDKPGQAQRFPLEMVEPVRELLARKVREMDVRVGVASAAAGADLLFIDAMRQLRRPVHLILPWQRDEFRKTSVLPYEPEASRPGLWEPMFDRALADAATLRELGQVYEPSNDIGWAYAPEVTVGIAMQVARASRLDLKPMVLWDGKPGGPTGGTSSFVDFWKGLLSNSPIVVSLPKVAAAASAAPRTARRDERCEQPLLQQEVKTMLFADIVGYSKLTEQAIPAFVGIFLEKTSALAAASKHAPRSLERWGDAVHAVFDYATDAGLFALELAEMVHNGANEWKQHGLYWGKDEEVNPLSIRIGLHTGPVFMHYDPLIRRIGFAGAHVTRAARIEPVAQPGQVFASEEFAAMAELGASLAAAADGSGIPDQRGFVCEYAGSMQLAKNYPGRFRVYRLLRKRGLDLECLARAAHEDYCAKEREKGHDSRTNSALLPWDDLPEDMKDANRAQAADIPKKLHLLGYRLDPARGIPPAEMAMSPVDVEWLARREHDRWMNERLRNGWAYGIPRDNARMRHPLLIPWEELDEPQRQKDRDVVVNLPALIELAGFKILKTERSAWRGFEE